uniref:ABC transporter permease n=1 Tax=Dichotomaria marginata TaxID=268567 RepID=A0A1G4NS97_9FLOR|nr:Hypothetical protein ycf63 [Dichotomaria marginata]SCW21485.1 Hypothetical protein ycf63 [Dichotomaria marginata]
MLLQINTSQWFYKVYIACSFLKKIIFTTNKSKRYIYHSLNQVQLMGVGSLTVVLATSFSLGMIFTFQVAKELSSLGIQQLVGSVLMITFVRELSPVLTAVIITGRIGSAFTAEIATMKVTEQIDVLYILNIDPFYYLVKPRIFACMLMLPILNILSLATCIASGIVVASILYEISPSIFLTASCCSSIDLLYSSIKSIVFGIIIGIISCAWGLTVTGGSKNVGKSTTSSVVTILLVIFIVDFFLSFIMFYSSNSLLNT